VLVNIILGSVAALSLALLLWQWLAALRFPLHQRIPNAAFTPPVTLLKPLKGCDDSTEACLRSWFTQEYTGPVQILFGVASAADPACAIVRKLQAEFPNGDGQLVVCGPLIGANAKVAKLAEMQKLATHEVLIVSDADVRVPPDFLAQAVAPLADASAGLVNCFYRLANPSTPAMQWEAVAINADFWSQVLQSKSLKPLDFALGAVMITRRRQLDEIGGFTALADTLADDYQLGNRIARHGHRIELCPAVVECWDPPQGWRAVWRHQLRWARTIRVCQPLPYFFSILSNATLWPLVWLLAQPSGLTALSAGLACLLRVTAAGSLQSRLARSHRHWTWAWLVPVKDLLQVVIWASAFAGNRVEWRGRRFTLLPNGTLVSIETANPAAAQDMEPGTDR
jgi:ceramide glucosyltransferase